MKHSTGGWQKTLFIALPAFIMAYPAAAREIRLSGELPASGTAVAIQ